MSLPSLLLSLILASLYGVAFYLVFGRGWLMLAVYWLSAVAGFAFGEFVSRALATNLLPIGSVNVVEASVMSLIALLLARTITQRR